MEMLEPIKHPLVYCGPGVYYPHIVGDRVTWRLDDTGDVLCGVNVESISNVRKFATLARIVNVQEARR